MPRPGCEVLKQLLRDWRLWLFSAGRTEQVCLGLPWHQRQLPTVMPVMVEM